jgi:ATP-dependent Clp protease ATP-binding subunit ClpA
MPQPYAFEHDMVIADYTNPHAERERLDAIKGTKRKLEEAKYELEVAQREGRYEQASKLRFATIPELERQLPSENEQSEGASGTTLIHDRVTSSDIARVVARATGIPVQSLLKGEKEKLVHVSCVNAGVILSVIEKFSLYRWRMPFVLVLWDKTMLLLL